MALDSVRKTWTAPLSPPATTAWLSERISPLWAVSVRPKRDMVLRSLRVRLLKMRMRLPEVTAKRSEVEAFEVFVE